MNRKYLSIAYLLILTIGTICSIYMPKAEPVKAESVVIPKEAIRLRILANSNSQEDQALKRLIRDEVNKNITGWVQDLTSLDQARRVIKSHLPDIQTISEDIVKKNGKQQNVKVKFGNAKFPTKLYGQYLYPAGEYEAIVITLGEGEGDNWWCVLFPPLCFLDFSNGTAVSQTPYPEQEEPEASSVPSDQANAEQSQANIDSDSLENEKTAAKEQVYVEQDESPIVVKSFFAELVQDIF
ncbi:stage II sporulation protein R [Peribacillus sp. SCS-155]|uniref:stage II sporulation protein R n=1 Tax=Peribacillus sedimenti TaxID=3115297 RepID=UPI0039063333